MPENSILLKCSSCKTLNRLPSSRLKDSPKCGKCKQELDFPVKPVQVKTSDFDHELTNWPSLVLVDFFATWCGPCRMMEPVLNELAEKRAGRLKILKVDVDSEPEPARRFGVNSTPTLILFVKGRKINQISGALNKEQLDAWIDSSVN